MKLYSENEKSLRILNEITKFCKECPSCECCPEEECVLYRIEKLVERNNKMKKYNVEIEETLSKIISIEAETKEEAKELEPGTTYVIYNPLTKIYKEEISGKNDIAHNKYAFDQLKYFIKKQV